MTPWLQATLGGVGEQAVTCKEAQKRMMRTFHVDFNCVRSDGQETC